MSKDEESRGNSRLFSHMEPFEIYDILCHACGQWLVDLMRWVPFDEPHSTKIGHIKIVATFPRPNFGEDGEAFRAWPEDKSWFLSLNRGKILERVGDPTDDLIWLKLRY